MSLFSKVKDEVEEIDLCIVEWTCSGRVYKIPLMNGNLEAQKEFLEVADMYEAGADGKPSELAKILGEFMYKLLKMKNAVTEEEAANAATVPNCRKVFDIWLGNE